MSEQKQQIDDLSNQLIVTVQQIKGAEQQIQLCNNQAAKCNIVITEIGKGESKGTKMYRSLGRMFVAQDPKELGKDLDNDLKGINNELSRQNEILKNLAVKKRGPHRTTQRPDPQDRVSTNFYYRNYQVIIKLKCKFIG